MKKIKRYFHYLSGHYLLFVATLFSSILSTLAKLFIPFLAGQVLNVLIGEMNPVFDLSFYFVLMAVLLMIGAIFGYLFQYGTSLLGQIVIETARKQVAASYLHCDISSLDREKQGDLLTRLVQDVENVQTGLVTGFSALFEGIVTIIVTLIFMFVLHWLLALAVLILTPLSLFIARKISKANAQNFKKQAETNGFLVSNVNESLANINSIQAYDLAALKEDEFDNLNKNNREAAFKANFASSLINPSTRLVNGIINVAIILLGSLLILNPISLGVSFFLGDLTAFLNYANNYMQPFNEITSVIAEIDYALASLKRIEEATSLKKDNDKGTLLLREEVTKLEAKNVNFAYETGKPIISDFNLDIWKGHQIALVGPTGSGKTTIVNLVMRFYDPQEGAFFFNEKEGQKIKKSALRAHLGMVLQDTWIFEGTVAENIAYGLPNAKTEDVIKAAKKAQAHEFIMRLPKGYQTLINDSSGLSAGERQLLTIARVFLLNPEIIILDEATSNIDMHTEALLTKSLQELTRGKTSIVIAHRLSTIVDADLIVVLRDGKIVETGNHRELIEKKGFYASLYGAQFN